MAHFDHDQLRNARFIIAVGKSMGMSYRDIQIGLMTAMQESSLRNITGGDRDSAGLFQQRPSQGWGTYEQVTDRLYSTRKFFSVLRGVDNRKRMSLAGAAQAVQRSADGSLYRQWAKPAARILGGKMGATVGPGDFGTPEPKGTAEPLPGMGQPDEKDDQFDELSDPTAPLAPISSALGGTLQGTDITQPISVAPVAGDTGSAAPGVEAATAPMAAGELSIPQLPTLGQMGQEAGGMPDMQGVNIGNATGERGQAIRFGRSFLGIPYVWGGTSRSGVDCSGLMQLIYKHVGINLPRLSADQARAGTRVPLKNLKPGDMVAWDNSTRNNGADHVALYLGNGRILEAARPGTDVRISNLYDRNIAWGVRFNY